MIPLQYRAVAIGAFIFAGAACAQQRLTTSQLQVVVDTGANGPIETFSIKDGEGWTTVLSASASSLFIRTEDGLQQCTISQAQPIDRGILITGKCSQNEFEQRITLTDEQDVLEVSTRLHLAAQKAGRPSPVHSVEDRYDFVPGLHPQDDAMQGPLDFAWSQNIKSEADDLIPTNSFKSPVVMMQQGRSFAAIIPALNQHRAEQRALDLDVTSGQRPWIGYGAIPSSPHDHSYFRRSPAEALETVDDTIAYQYSLLLSPQPARLGYRRAVHLLWQQVGHSALLASSDTQQNVLRPELRSFASWRQDAWHTYADRVYLAFPCAQAKQLPCGTLASNRNYRGDWEKPVPDAWFNAWFQTLRTAYGWYVYARDTRDTAMMAKGESVLNLALQSPRNKGAFSTIYLAGKDNSQHQWVPGDGWASYADSYHAFSMSWTAYWMLRWADDLLPARRQEILAFVKPYGDFLISHQQPGGNIPSWYDAVTLKEREAFQTFNAETAPSALLLATLGTSSGDERYTVAAERAMDFVVREVLPRQRWFDFETYLSCARKDYGFYDRWTAQYPQNNLAEIQAPQAMLALYRATGKQEYLERGTQMLDYLLLTQQVWNNPLFTPSLFGGFTTQNTDQEWSDARQGYAATVLSDYYDATGNVEYLERAVAAARSTFAVAPWENWAHTGVHDEPGALTGFHWGTGSAMTSIELMQPHLGDALIDVTARRGVGFDDCTITDVDVKNKTISFHITSPTMLRTFLIRFRGLQPSERYSVSWNGGPAVPVDGNTLMTSGLTLPSVAPEATAASAMP